MCGLPPKAYPIASFPHCGLNVGDFVPLRLKGWEAEKNNDERRGRLASKYKIVVSLGFQVINNISVSHKPVH